MSVTPMQPSDRAMIGKWSVDRYLTLIRPWALIAGLVVIAGALTSQPRELVMLWEVLVIGGFGWLVAKHDGGKVEALTTGAMVGAVLGIAASVGGYVHVPSLSTGLNIIVETILTTAVAPFLAVSVLIATKLRQTHST